MSTSSHSLITSEPPKVFISFAFDAETQKQFAEAWQHFQKVAKRWAIRMKSSLFHDDIIQDALCSIISGGIEEPDRRVCDVRSYVLSLLRQDLVTEAQPKTVSRTDFLVDKFNDKNLGREDGTGNAKVARTKVCVDADQVIDKWIRRLDVSCPIHGELSDLTRRGVPHAA